MKNKVFIVAEMSANHNNDFDTAVKTIEAMAKSGADAVKIQTYRPESLCVDVDNEFFCPKKEGLWKGWKPWDLYQQASMPYEWQHKLKKVAENLGLVFFSSPFDLEAVDFLENLNVPLYKIASFEINDIPLIQKVASTKKPVIISTGIATIDDIQLAINTCYQSGNRNVSLLKCTSEYPSTIEMANLSTIIDMKQRFKVTIGLSDHTLGFTVPIVAVSLGAKIVEKHFILDRKFGGCDAPFSMEPSEFKSMVDQIRLAESAMGSVSYNVLEKDLNRRRSLFAVEDIGKNEVLTKKNVRSIRPGNGLPPLYYNEVLGKKTKIKIKKGTPLSWDLLNADDYSDISRVFGKTKRN